MAKQSINVGATANDKKGDSLRAAFQKVNANFTELYTALGLNSDGTLNLGAFEFTGSTMSTTDSTPIVIDQAVTVNSDLIVGGDVLPSVARGGNLGSPSKPFNSLYVSTNTVFLGGVPLSLSAGTNELTINNVPISQTITYTDIPNVPADISDLTDTQGLLGGGAASTGDITFNTNKIIGSGTASGDGLGYATLELVPDGTLATDQYIVVDPTTPNHIHLRAGGTQDASTAELYLGGERNNVRVSDYSGVRLNNNLLATNTTRQFDNTTDFTNATWSVIEPGVYYLIFRTSLQELQTVHDQVGSWPDNTIEISDGTNFYTLTYNGYSSYLGNPNDRVVQVREAPPGGTTVTVQAMTFTINTLQSNYLSLENSIFETYVNDYAYLGANGTIELVTGTGNLKISVNDNINSQSWYFNTKGHLEFPQGVAPTTSKGSDGDEIGAVVFDGTHIYYCIESYSDGVNDIWKRVAWSNDTW